MRTKQGTKSAARIYLDWTNNYLSLEVFAAAYGWTYTKAAKVIEKGRAEHERNCTARSYFTKPDGAIAPTRNLRGLLDRSRKDTVEKVVVFTLADNRARLVANFASGWVFTCLFESKSVCIDFARNPRRRWFGCPVVVS